MKLNPNELIVDSPKSIIYLKILYEYFVIIFFDSKKTKMSKFFMELQGIGLKLPISCQKYQNTTSKILKISRNFLLSAT